MNGVTITYSLLKPVNWNQFKHWPSDIQKEYLTMCQERFHASDERIGAMMGVSGHIVGHVRRACHITAAGWKKPTDEWSDFLAGKLWEPTKVEEHEYPDPEEKAVYVEPQDPPLEAYLSEGTLFFKDANPMEVANKLSVLLGRTNKYNFTICFARKENK